MIKILFVCHGNICRSPMAEYIMKDLVKKAGVEKEFFISSAATSREEIGNDIYPMAKQTLAKYKIPFGRHRARQVTKEDYEIYDCIFVMDNNNIRNLNRIFNDTLGKVSLLMKCAGSNASVADPWYTGDFETACNDILTACSAFLENYNQSV